METYKPKEEQTKIANDLGYKNLDEMLIKLYKKFSASAIARELNWTYPNVIYHYNRLGLIPMARGGNWRTHIKHIG